MAEPPPRIGSMAYFYGPILESALGRMTTAEMWDEIHAQATAAGVRLPADALMQVNDLRANAAGVRDAAYNLERGAPEQAITSSVIGQPIYARPLDAQEALGQWEARVRMTLQDAAGQSQQWVRIVFGADRPDTVGELMDTLDAYAQDMAAGYGQVLISWDAPMLNAI